MTEPAAPASAPPVTATPKALLDAYGRRITYLRLSLTDRCNLRCRYCMVAGTRFATRADLLSDEELVAIAATFVELGVRKIRLTGGEPLVRRGALALIRRLAALPGLSELVMTTNGTRLEPVATGLRSAGVQRLNISLDTLRPERFRAITGGGDSRQVQRGIAAAVAAGFERIKLNAVILQGYNDDEIIDLARFAMDKGLNLSFIEAMPMGRVAGDDRTAYYSSERVRTDLERALELIPTTETTGGPARYFRIPGSETRVGFISPHSHNFCADCNRVRVTAEGSLLLCLGQDHSLDLRRILREHPGESAPLREGILEALRIKPEGSVFAGDSAPIGFREMHKSGG